MARTLAACHRQRAQFAGLDVPQRGGQVAKKHGHLAADHVVQSRATAFVGDVRHLHFGGRLKQRAGQVLRRAVAGRGKSHARLCCARQRRSALSTDLRRKLRVDQHHVGEQRDHADGSKGFFGVVGQLGVQRGVHRERGGVKHQRVAVGRGLGDGGGADLAAGTGLVFHDHGLAQRLAQLGRHQPRHGVGAAAGRVGDDQRDRFAGPGAVRTGRGHKAAASRC